MQCFKHQRVDGRAHAAGRGRGGRRAPGKRAAAGQLCRADHLAGWLQPGALPSSLWQLYRIGRLHPGSLSEHDDSLPYKNMRMWHACCSCDNNGHRQQSAHLLENRLQKQGGKLRELPAI